MHRMPSLVAETHSSRATAFVDRVMSSAPPMPDINMFSTLERGKTRPSAHEVHIKVNEYTKPTPIVRFLGPRDNASAFAVSREIKENKNVRPANFQNWVKKFNNLGDPYDHLASFK